MPESGSNESVRAAVRNSPPRRLASGTRTRTHWATLRARIPFVVALVLVAFLLRAIAAVAVEQALYAAGRDGFLGVDDVGYDGLAWRQAQAWRGLAPPFDASYGPYINLYIYTAAALYWVTGHQPLAMKLLNCLFGALAAGLIFSIARRLFGYLAACLSGIAAAFFPTTFFWSVVHMKDTMLLFCVALLLWLMTWLVTTARWWLIPPLLVTLAPIGSLRIYIQGLVCMLVPTAVILQSRARFPRKWATGAVLVVACTTILWFSGGVNWLGTYFPLLNNQRYNMARSASSAYVPTPVPTASGPLPADTPVASPRSSLIGWLPTGLAYALAAPFPWAARRTIERIIIPEMLLWYLFLALAALGLAVHWRSWQRYVHLLGYLAGVLLLFAIGQGNFGTLIRHRSTMLVPFVVIFSGAGAAWLWSYVRARRGTPATLP